MIGARETLAVGFLNKVLFFIFPDSFHLLWNTAAIFVDLMVQRHAAIILSS